MSVSIMFWNVWGVASQNFHQSFASLVKNYNPIMVVILEPTISRIKADYFIKKSGF